MSIKNSWKVTELLGWSLNPAPILEFHFYDFSRCFSLWEWLRNSWKFLQQNSKFVVGYNEQIIHCQKKKNRFNQSWVLTWLIQASLKTSRFSCATLLLGLEAKILAALMTCEQKIGGLGQDWKSILCHGRFPRSKLWTRSTVNDALAQNSIFLYCAWCHQK